MTRCLSALLLLAVAGAVGGQAPRPSPPSLQFDFAPVVGYSKGFTCQGVSWKHCPGVVSVEITIYHAHSILGFTFDTPAGAESYPASLPQGAWGANIGGLRSGATITRAVATLRDTDGAILIETRIKADCVVP